MGSPETNYTTIVKKQGNSNCVFIPKMQMDLLGIKNGDVVEITIRRASDDLQRKGDPADDQRGCRCDDREHEGHGPGMKRLNARHQDREGI